MNNYPMGTSGSDDYFNQPEYECPICYVTLEEDWEFCPGCGTHIDWEELRCQPRLSSSRES